MTDDSEASALVAATRAGDVAAVQKLANETPGLASSSLGGKAGSRTPLHIVTDWPGFFPNGPLVVRVLIAAGADPNARDPGKGSETPLHWAASNDDVQVASALIEGGADIEAADGSIGTAWRRAPNNIRRSTGARDPSMGRRITSTTSLCRRPA